MVSEIEFGIKRGTEQSQKGDDFEKFFSQQAGPGGCKTEEECFAYCNDSAHGAECISFGAKHEVFQGNEAVERYQKYNDILKNPSPSNYANQTGQYGENRLNQEGQKTSGQVLSRKRQSQPYVNQGGLIIRGRSGPSPECFGHTIPAISPKLKKFAALRLTRIKISNISRRSIINTSSLPRR